MRARVALGGLALLLAAACADRPKPARAVVEPLPPSRPQRIATFEAVIEPPTPGPGGSRGSALWTTMPTGSDGLPDKNPPRTLEIASDTPFVQVASGPGGTCLGGAIQSLVHIKNFMPERLAGLFVVITSLSDTNRVVCDPGVLPAGGVFPWGSPVIGNVTFVAPVGVVNPYGSIIDYTDVSTYPYASLDASAVADGSAPGGNLTKDWYLNFPTGTGNFTIKGEIWADAFPNAPRVAGDTLGGFVEEDETLHWFLYDNKDKYTNPAVSQMKALLCTVAFSGGTCGGTQVVLDDAFPGNGIVDTNAHGAGFGTYDAPLATLGLTVGQTYFLDARSHFNGLDGTFAQNESFVITGKPAQVAPADNAPAIPRDASTPFTWTVAYPAETGPSSDVVFEICTTANCGDAADPVISLLTTTTATQDQPNVWTFSVTPNLVTLAAGADHFWHVRHHFAFRNGPWQGMRKFTTAP